MVEGTSAIFTSCTSTDSVPSTTTTKPRPMPANLSTLINALPELPLS